LIIVFLFITGIIVFQTFFVEERFIVAKVIDGDTLQLADGRQIRLIGVDAPERGQYYYEESRDALKRLVEGKEVRLEKDVSEEDERGRLLRYVFIDDVFVNAEMIRLGYAVVRVVSPDTERVAQLIQAEEEAKGKEVGLWEVERSEFYGCVVITNFNWDAKGDDRQNLNDEYVTFQNVCNFSISLKGWSVSDAAWHIYQFGERTLSAGAKITLHTGSGDENVTDLYWGRSWPVWNNDGDTLYLRDVDDKIVTIESYAK